MKAHPISLVVGVGIFTTFGILQAQATLSQPSSQSSDRILTDEIRYPPVVSRKAVFRPQVRSRLHWHDVTYTVKKNWESCDSARQTFSDAGPTRHPDRFKKPHAD